MKKFTGLLLAALLLICTVGAGRPILADDDPTAKPTSEPIWKEGLLTLGTVNGDVYENTTLGYGCKLEGWTIADAAAIAAMNNIGESLVSADVQELIRQGGSFIEFSASSADNLQSITVTFQDIEKNYGAAASLFTVDQLVEAMLPMLPSMLENAGFSDVKAESAQIPLGTDLHPGIVITSKIYGVDAYQKEACIRCGDYMAFVCVSSFASDATDDILKLFYPLTETVVYSPAEELNFALRLPDASYSYEMDEQSVSFTKSDDVETLAVISMMSQDASILGMALTPELIDMMLEMLQGQFSSEESESNFSEITDGLAGGKYAARTCSGTAEVSGITVKMDLTAWSADSHLYIMLLLAQEDQADATYTVYRSLLDSFETAGDYLARTGAAPEAALDPAA